MPTTGPDGGTSTTVTTAATATIPGAPASEYQASSWEVQLLQALGAPTSDSNIAALYWWGLSEGTSGENNPLAISGVHAGATGCLAQCGSSSPVMSYATMADGVNATAAFLQGSYYTAIVGNLKASADPREIWGAINASAWCKGCQGGKYPSALATAIIKGGNALPDLSASAAGAVSPVGSGVVKDVTGAVSGTVSALSGIGSAFSWLSGGGFARIGKGALGVVLILFGMILIISETSVGKGAVKAAETGAME